MKKWTTTLQVRVEKSLDYEWPDPLWFCLALNPLSYLLNRTNYGCGIHYGDQEMQRLNYLLYMDDIKLYVATNNQLQELLRLTQTFLRDTKIVFEIEKCKTLRIAKGKLEMRNFTTEGEDTMEAMNEDDMYRYLGHMQAKQIRHARMKQKLGEEYLNRTKSVLKTKLSGKNTIKAINTYATASTKF